MKDSQKTDYQKLYPGDKRHIIEKLRKLLVNLYDAYGPNYHENIPVGMIILSNKEIIKDFIGLMRSEVKSYTQKSTTNNDISLNKMSILPEKMKDSVEYSSVNKQDTIILSDDVKNYIDLMIQDIVSKQLNEKVKPIFECLDQYEEEIRIYKEREAKFRERNTDDSSDLYVDNQDVNIYKAADGLVQKKGETCKQNNSVRTVVPKYSSAEQEQENVRKLKNVGVMDSLLNSIQEQIRASLDIYNKNTAVNNFAIRRKMEKIFNKQMLRLVLPNEDAKDFADKPIKDLRNDKTHQTVFLERTDGSSDYIAALVSANVYAVFPVKFEPYTQSFAWKRAYPIFFDILPNDEMEASSYVLTQPAFFQKKGEQYQMLENGKGCIELVP